MDNIIKEQIGVHQLSIKLLSTCQLIPDIKFNDKTPSFDGTVEIYIENSIRKESQIGIVDVQVKTTEQKSKIRRFSIEKTDLERFLERDGVLFFVIYLDENQQPIVRYRDLHVFTILKFLKYVGKRKEISFDMYPFPDNKNEIVNIFLNFMHLRGFNEGTEKRNEITKRLYGNFTKDNKELNLHFAFTPNSTHQEQIRFMLSHKTILFDSTVASSFEIPVDEVQIDSITETIPIPIRIEDTVFYDSYELVSTKGGLEVIIGNCLHIYPGKTEVLLTTEDIPLFSERKKALEFMNALYKGKNFFRGDKKINYPIIRKDYSEDIQKTNDLINIFSMVQTFLSAINVKEDFDFSLATDYEWDKLVTIAESYLKLKPLTFENSKSLDSRVMGIKAGNLYLLLYFYSDKEKKYYCKNFFDEENLISYVIEEESHQHFIMSKYLLLEAKDLLKYSNIDFSKIEESLFHYALTSINEGMITQFILQLITAYDMSGSIRNEILDCAKQICERLIKEKNEKSCETEMINLYQIISRQRELTISEIEKLILIKNSFDNKEGQICINILLKNFDEAEKQYNGLNEKEKNIFNGYPICKLWGREYEIDKIADNLPI